MSGQVNLSLQGAQGSAEINNDGVLEQPSMLCWEQPDRPPDRHSYIHIHFITYIHIHMHTYIHIHFITYIHTYIYTLLHKYSYMSSATFLKLKLYHYGS